MSTARSKAGKRSNSMTKSGVEAPVEPTEVLTLGEAAAYLRVAEAEVVRLANLLDLPGRAIGGEWRFLKTALQDWLRTPVRKPGKEAFLALAGAWKDDPDIDQIVREALQQRGRPMAGREK
jgi:excisionase family DNA binding protein